MSTGPIERPDAFVKEDPKLPGNWKCLRVQRAPFGPFFEWAELTSLVELGEKCPHCDGDGELSVESLKTYESKDVDCPWCHGTGDAEDCDELSPIVRSTALRIWCDGYGNVLDVQTELESGWISFAWLAQYEPPAPLA